MSPKDANSPWKSDSDWKDSNRTGVPAVGFFESLVDHARTLGKLLTDPYYTVSFPAKLKIIACLVYFVSPIDLIPDFILGIGVVDDAVLFAYLLKVIKDVIDDYRKTRKGATVVDAKPVERET